VEREGMGTLRYMIYQCHLPTCDTAYILDIIKYRMTQGDVLHCFVVIKYMPSVILKPLPIARLWEMRKFLDLVREFIKMSGLFCL